VALRRLPWLWGLNMRNWMAAFSALRALRALRTVAILGGVFGVSCAVAAGLNDTGMTTCADAAGAIVSCTAATAVQGQDARYGRDAAAGTGALTKVGGGANGFDFTKISNGTASVPGVVLPSSAALGTGSNDWGCTYDNTTGLMWEVKTYSGLRGGGSIYTWYSTNAATNGGNVGMPYPGGNGACFLAGFGRCDTEKFTQDVNAIAMCGHSDWRMPTFRELTSLVRHGVNPTIDGGYFPNTEVNYFFWSGSPVANNSASAWSVNFSNGTPSGSSRYGYGQVRLVRIGQ